MSLYLAVKTGRIEGIDEIRNRLGDSGTIRGNVTPILKEGARVGAAAARTAAPRGVTKGLTEAIADDAFVFRVRKDVVNVRFGVQPVRDPGRGSPFYPVYVHEGTGLYGRLHRVITAKRAGQMVFPGGGKPWPTIFGRTGRVKRFSVRGQKPQPYMAVAYEEAKRFIETHLDDMARRLVE